MRNTLILGLSVALLGIVGFGQSQSAQTPLGDVARQQRADKTAAAKRVITNEDLPSSSTGVTVAPSSPTDSGATAKDTASKTKDTKKPAEATGDSTSSSNTPADTDYRAQIQKQRAEIAKLEKELSELQHKEQVQSTNAYMDAGARLRDPKAWSEQRAKLDKDIDSRQQKLQDARTKLEDLLEQARKLGISTASLE